MRQEPGEIDTAIMQLLLGGRTSEILPKALNVFAFVDAVDKDVEGFRRGYDALSEFAHPNWAGTLRIYGRPDAENRRVIPGRNVREPASGGIGVHALSGGLLVFDVAYRTIGRQTPAFIELRECSL